MRSQTRGSKLQATCLNQKMLAEWFLNRLHWLWGKKELSDQIKVAEC